MLLQKARFTIRQLMALVFTSGIFFALLRVFDAGLVIATGVVVLGFLIERWRKGSGILGGTIAGGTLFLGLGIALYVWAYIFPEPARSDLLGPVRTLSILLVYGLIWGAIVSTALYFILKRTKQYLGRRPLRDDSCGPIVWRPLGRTRTAISDSR
jgi:hypothetical protein